MTRKSSGPSKPKPTPVRMNSEQMRAVFLHDYNHGRYELALRTALSVARAAPKTLSAWADAAVCCVHLERWQDSIKYGLQAYALSPKHIPTLDALAHAYGALRQWDKVKYYGVRALQQRDLRYGQTLVAPVSRIELINESMKMVNVIAFSLFGGSSKYCETAVLNTIEQPHLYPDWQCWFFVDDTVPEHVIARLRQHGAKVLSVNEEQKKWPSPMWRFAAYDDPTVARVIFRDADSVISTREASAVLEWVQSGQAFHMMRDSGTHTELILAGLWGCVRDSLPPMHQLISEFLRQPVESVHFADQYFLRQLIWPYAKTNIMQHDALFGFMDGLPFPDGAHRDDFHVGYAEGSPFFEAQVAREDGVQVNWALWNQKQIPEQLVCRYSAMVAGQKIKAHLPARYAKLLGNGYVVRLEV